MDGATLQRYQREVMEARTRLELNRITVRIWKMWDFPANQVPLAQLRKAIEARREALARNNPR
ncbi:MAG TPA: hypothetical protein VF981_07970 [Gemmatimonadaceae bacterium]